MIGILEISYKKWDQATAKHQPTMRQKNVGQSPSLESDRQVNKQMQVGVFERVCVHFSSPTQHKEQADEPCMCSHAVGDLSGDLSLTGRTCRQTWRVT